MRLRDAIEMLAESAVGALGPTIWADLGCGDGSFTRALADMLASGSLIHAIDLEGSALRRIPPAHKAVRISTYHGDFMTQPWPFTTWMAFSWPTRFTMLRTRRRSFANVNPT